MLAACLLQGCGVDPIKQEQANQLYAENVAIYAATPSPDADYGIAPKDAAASIKKYLSLKDPYSAKWSNATKPKTEYIFIKSSSGNTYYPHVKPVYGYSSCITVNAKNGYGAYAGDTTYWAFFVNDILMNLIEDDSATRAGFSVLTSTIGRDETLSNPNPKPFNACD